MSITLPDTKIKAVSEDPKFFIYFGKPKSGKSEIAAKLENNLIIDLENGYNSIDALKVNANTFNDLISIIKQLEDYKNSNGGKNKYKYITIDNGSVLEEVLLPYAKLLYMKTPAGKRFQGDDVRDLEMGSGYRFTRMALLNIIDRFKEFCETLILICHTKDSIINKEGQELSEMSIALTGASARILAANADAIGYLYRKKNQNVMNFNGGGDLIVEARPKHLRGKEIVIAESNPDDPEKKVVAYWDKIFLDLNNNLNQAA